VQCRIEVNKLNVLFDNAVKFVIIIPKTGAQRQRKHRLISTSLPMSFALRASAQSLGFLMGYNNEKCGDVWFISGTQIPGSRCSR